MDGTGSSSRRNASFPTTRWSRVVAAGDGDEVVASEALEGLCIDYWYPLYAFARRKGLGPEEAADLVQSTFAALLSRRGFEGLAPEKGRFRSYLMAVCTHQLQDRRDGERAAKRGGGRVLISIDQETAENRYRVEPAHEWTAERLFERRWALDLLERCVNRLEAELSTSGQTELASRLIPTLTGAGRPLAEVGAELGMSEGAVKMAASRMRRRYGALLREEVARTLGDAGDVESELAALFSALGP